MTSGVQSKDRWLFGPVPDLFLGGGLAYAVVFGALTVAGPWIRAHQPIYFLPLLITLFSMPHYGATLLRVYEQRSERRAYALFSVWASLVLFALFVAGVHVPLIGSILLTVYLTWSPWHYTGQNYGIALVMLRRVGFDPPVDLKRWIYASFILSYALGFLAMHSQLSAGYNALASETERVVFLPLGIPWDVGTLVIPSVGIAYLIASVVAVTGVLRRIPLRDAAPGLMLGMTQALWVTIPFSVRYFGVHTGIAPIDGSYVIRDYTLWIFIGHGVQYLWITSYYARRAQGARGLPVYLLKALAAGVAIWTLPFMVFAPGGFGNLPFDVGMASLVASAVNIHHFILDGAIWKLRNSRIAGVLIRSNQVEPDVPGSRSGWLRGLVWCGAIAGLAVGFFELAERRIAYPAALERGELERAETALDRLARVGYDRAMLRHGLAKRYAGRGDLDAAAEQHRRGLNLNPDPAQWLQLARLEEKRAHIEEADAAYQQALALGVERPDRVHAAIARTARLRGASDRAIQHLREALRLNPDSRSYANELAWNLATAPDAELREPEEAILLAHAVVEASPTPDASALDTLAAAYAAAARFDEATATASRAANLAKAQGKEALHRDISGKLALYRERRPFVDVPPEN